eukprot:CAMPEP_0183469650 /NCGR_PEP_ID=MMETSP0370-20130417/154842_1 /TAXON_ID=268820 /ORGANISM="Peridinium aciculiferum, Strain PAER-2" /LENGTH=61 /DNA_ID=CAMNT_0025662127 /DNA_START=132 /DNA_END=314 /DNA_ORIENTATION=-
MALSGWPALAQPFSSVAYMMVLGAMERLQSLKSSIASSTKPPVTSASSMQESVTPSGVRPL